MAKKIITFDFETFLIGTQYPEPHGYQTAAPIPVCMSYKQGRDKPQLTQEEMGTLVHEWLMDDDVVLINQNIAFDFMCAVTHLGINIKDVFAKYNKGLVRDTMIREQLIALANGEAVRNPNKRYNLAALVKKYLNKDISASKGADAWRLRYSELYEVPLEEWPQDAIDYPLDDVTHAMQVFAHQQKVRELFQDNELEQTRASFDLHILTLNSPRVDPVAVEQFEEAHIGAVETARAPLIKHGIMRWNKNRYTKFDKDDERRGGWSMDNKKFHKVIANDYAKQGKEAPLTPTGKVKTDADTLLGCKNKALHQYGLSAADIKLVDGFLPGLQAAGKIPEGRVSPRYNVILKTGRTSCSKPNLQQLPKRPGGRECFIPEDGHVFVSIDYDTMEMFALAQTVYDKWGNDILLNALNDEKDPHLMVCQNITGQSYEELVALKEAGDTGLKQYRALGKILNFGQAGGMGALTTVGNMSESDLDVLNTLYPNQYPVAVMKSLGKIWRDQWMLNEFFEHCGRLCAGGNKPTYTCPRTGRIKKYNTYCQLCNAHFQPIAADAMKEALKLVTEDCYIKNKLLNRHGVKLCVEIHDEFLFSGPEDSIDQWVPYAQHLMALGAQRWLPDCKIRTGAGVCGDRWRKNDIELSDWLAGDRHD